MRIRINDKNGNNIAECDLHHHDIWGFGIIKQKSNIFQHIWRYNSNRNRI